MRSTTVAIAMTMGLALTAAPAEAKKMKPIYPIAETRVVGAGTIRVVPPLVRFDSYPGGDGGRRENNQEIAAWLTGIAGETLSGRGFRVEPLSADDGTVGKLTELADRYVRDRRGEEATAELLADVGGDGAAVLIQYLEVKIGERGSWNGYTGQLAVGMSNSRLRGVLLDPATGEELWRGELYYRDIPRADNKKWNAHVAQMYATLLNGGEDR